MHSFTEVFNYLNRLQEVTLILLLHHDNQTGYTGNLLVYGHYFGMLKVGLFMSVGYNR